MFFYGICGLVISILVFVWMFSTIKENKLKNNNIKGLIIYNSISGASLIVLSVLMFIDNNILNIIAIVLMVLIMLSLVIVISKIEKKNRPVKKIKLKKINKNKYLVENKDNENNEKN